MTAVIEPSLVTVQHQVLDVVQAGHLFGFGEVRSKLRRGLWQRPHPDVVVLHNGPLSSVQRIWVASLAGPPGSALWGPTAAVLDGLRGFDDEDQVHLVLPPGLRRLRIPWVRSHWSSQLSELDVHPAAVPHRTRLPRSLLDMAADTREERHARGILMAGAQQRLVTVDSLRKALARRGHCRHRALLVETLQDISGGIHSVPERDFALIVKRRGLPLPTRQAIRRRPSGLYYLDVLWLPFGLAVEVDGGHHRSATVWDADLDRVADISADGLRVVRFTSFAVRRRPVRVGDLLTANLRAGGLVG
jgi:very-short-patch-repair endonuclease